MNIEFSSQPKKFLKKVPSDLAKRVFTRIEELAKEPFPKDVKRVVSRKAKVFRIRLGDYRIEYVVDQDTLLITAIEKRARAYR